MMQAIKTLPNARQLLAAWRPYQKTIGFAVIRSQSQYRRARAIIDMLLDTIGEDDEHPLSGLLDVMTELVEKYEQEHYQNLR